LNQPEKVYEEGKKRAKWRVIGFGFALFVLVWIIIYLSHPSQKKNIRDKVRKNPG